MIHLLDRSVSIHTLAPGANNVQSYTTVTAEADCTIQPLGESKTGVAGGSSQKMYVIYLDASVVVNPGDKFKDANGNWYKVVSGGIERRDDGSIADHLKVTVQKTN